MRTLAQQLQPPRPWRPPYWPFQITERVGTWLRWTARIWLVVATALFAFLALQGYLPRGLDRQSWEVTAQLAALGVVVLGEIVAWRFQAIGASIITIAAAVLGVLAAIGHPPVEAFGIALIFFVPGFLYWLDWQRTRSVQIIATLALVITVILGAGGFAANQVYAAYRGPTHPASAAVAPPITVVKWVWAGAQTDTSVIVNAKLAKDSDSVYLAVSEAQDMSNPTVFGPLAASAQTNNRIVSFAAAGLKPNTPYYYAVQSGGEMDLGRQGQFRTLADGPFSFTFAVGGDARSGSNGMVFDAIRESNPLFFLAVGDLFYADIAANNPAIYRAAYDELMDSPAQAALYRSTPIEYLWDDHDFGPNDADRTAPGREAAERVYRQVVPHRQLAAGDETGPIYRAFTVGRVRFIVTDERSEKSPRSEPDTAAKSMLGTAQKEWLKQELLAANGKYPLIVWVGTLPWIGPAQANGDFWDGYATERQELADFIAEHQIKGLLRIAGDAHMIAIDNGSNSDYSTSHTDGFKVFHASALDRRGGVKGGPYSESTYPGGGHFGLVSVDDDGGQTITVTLTGKNYRGEEIVSYTYTVSATGAH